MLILARKLGESITIGDNIRVTVVAMKGNQVRLGIEAPADIMVHRTEIYTKIVDENREAIATGPVDSTALRNLWEQHTRRR